MQRSRHRRGQLLVLVAALLGTVIGGAMALVVEDAGTGTAVAAPGPRRGTTLATRPPASQPAGSQAGRAGSQADGSDASGIQPAKWAHRPDKRNGKAALYMMAMVQVRRPSPGQAYYQRKRAEGKSAKEALRCLKRRLSDAVYRCLLADQHLQPRPVGLRPV